MTKEIQQVFCTSASRAYEWDLFFVYKHPRESRKYVVDSGSGCSCNYYETPTVAQLEAETPLGKIEVYKAFSEWYARADSYERGTKVDILEQLRSAL